jgi:hypothetical protein
MEDRGRGEGVGMKREMENVKLEDGESALLRLGGKRASIRPPFWQSGSRSEPCPGGSTFLGGVCSGESELFLRIFVPDSWWGKFNEQDCPASDFGFMPPGLLPRIFGKIQFLPRNLLTGSVLEITLPAELRVGQRQGPGLKSAFTSAVTERILCPLR